MAKEITADEIMSDPKVQAAIEQAKQEAIEMAMAELTPEQREYFQLKTAMEKMHRTFTKLQDEGKIKYCIPSDTETFGKTYFIVEGIFYGYMNRLIIDKRAADAENSKEEDGWSTGR